MNPTLYKRFRTLVLQSFTVTGIRDVLGEALDDFTDEALIKLMLEILQSYS